MSKEQEVAVIHPEGERELVVVGGPNQGSTVDTYGGNIHVRWDETAAVTPFGQLAFFIEFLKTAGLWDGWVQECPVTYESPNAPAKTDVLGTILLSVLASLGARQKLPSSARLELPSLRTGLRSAGALVIIRAVGAQA